MGRFFTITIRRDSFELRLHRDAITLLVDVHYVYFFQDPTGVIALHAEDVLIRRYGTAVGGCSELIGLRPLVQVYILLVLRHPRLQRLVVQLGTAFGHRTTTMTIVGVQRQHSGYQQERGGT